MKPSLTEKIVLILCALSVFLTLALKSTVYKSAPIKDREKILSTIAKGKVEEIILHYHDRRPYHLTFKDSVHGLVADPINLAFQRADIPFTWRETPAKRQLNIISSNEDKSCAAGWFKTDERLAFAQFSRPIYRDKPFVAVIRSDTTLHNSSGTLEEVFHNNRLLLLVKAGYSYGAYIDELLLKYSPWTLSTTVDNRGMLQMLLNHRADYTLMTEEEARDLLLFSGLNTDQFSLVYFSDMPEGNQRYIMCTKKIDVKTMDRLNEAIKLLSSSGETK